jgi:hypothetical protein
LCGVHELRVKPWAVLLKTATCAWLILADTDENRRLRARGLMPVGEAAGAGPGRAPRPGRKVKIFIRDQWQRLAAATGQGGQHGGPGR